MRAFFITLILSFTVQMVQAFVSFEVQPLSLKAKAEVMGVHAGVYGKDAIILTGHAAVKIAEVAGYSLKKTKEMIVITGEEVTSLLISSTGLAYNTGKFILVTTAQFASAGLSLAYDTLYSVGQFAFLSVNTTANLAKDVVAITLKAILGSVYVVTDTGLNLLKAPLQIVAGTLVFVCKIPNFFGIGLIVCE